MPQSPSPYTIEPPTPQYHIDTGAGNDGNSQQVSKYTVEPPVAQPQQSSQPSNSWPEWFERGLEIANKYGVQPFNKLASLGTEAGADIFQGALTGQGPYTAAAQSTMGITPTDIPTGIARGLGGLTGGAVADPRNWPFLGSGAARPLLQRLISGGFGVMMGHDAIVGAQELGTNWDKLTPEQRTEALTKIGGGTLMSGLAGSHAIMGGDVRLTSDEHNYLMGAIQQHLETSLSKGDLTGVDDAVSALQMVQSKLTPQEQSSLRLFTARYPKEIADLTAKADAGDVNAQNELRAILQGTRKTNIGPPAGQVERRASEPTKPPVPEVQANVPQPEGIPPSAGGIGSEAQAPNAPEGGIEAIRNDTGVTGGEGTTSPNVINGPDEGGDRGEAAQRVLSTLVPDFQQSLSTGEPARSEPSTLPPNNAEAPPVISEAVDNDLSNGGISVVRGGDDIGWVNRYLGSLTQAARRLGNPIFKAIADRVADVSIAIARNTRDSVRGFQKSVRISVKPNEWDQVVSLLNDPNVTVNNIPPTIPDNIRNAYTFTRNLLEDHRIRAINAKRLELIAGGMTSAKANELIPDDWGIKQGYYVHAFPGNWTITQHGGIDERGNDIWEPIDTGWRATTLSDAQAKARSYLANNPNANLKVQLDNISLPGRGISDRARLQALHDEIKNASAFIHNGANPEGVLTDLRQSSGALTYGPRRPAPRQFGPTMQREANLPGWARDMDNFERYIIGMERYIQLAPARAELLKYRNMLANQSGMAPITKPGEIPKRYSGDYANMLGRTDAAIEALEGYPTGFESTIRNTLQKMGYDPNLLNNAYSTVNAAEALLKLGFNPASAGLHLAQTLAATYPVLGERWTAHGILNAYSSNYDSLVHDLGIEATSNLMDIDSFQAYRGGYLNNITGPITAAKAGFRALSDTGLFMFSKGVETARRISAIGAYDKGISEGMSPQQARDYARDTLIRTQFLYSPADQSIFMRNIPRPMGQFKNFTLKMAEFVYGLRGTEIPRFLAAMGVIGYAGLPALGALSGAIKWLTGQDVENDFKRAFPRFSRGALGYAGIDYTKNIGFSDWLGGNTLDPSHLLGPGASDILNLAKGGAAELKGPSREGATDIDNALRNISPEARRIWDEGLRMANGGNLTDPKTGSIIIKNLTPEERVLSLMGLTPLRVAEERESHEYIRNQIEQSKDKRGYFVDKLAENQLELMRPGLSDKQKAELFKETVNLQKMAVEYGQGRQLAQAVRERMKGMMQERLTRDIKGAPKAERPGIQKEIQRYRIEAP